MKKISILIILIISIFSCSSINLEFNKIENEHYIKLKDFKKNLHKLEIGDILVFEKDSAISFGHISIIGKDKKVIELPKYSKFPKFKIINSIREMPLELISLSNPERRVLVIRYKYMDDKFKSKLLEKIYSKINLKYNAIFPRYKYSNYAYCSTLVYNVYEEVNKEIGHIDGSLFPFNSEIIWPSEFIYSGENFYIVNFKE